MEYKEDSIAFSSGSYSDERQRTSTKSSKQSSDFKNLNLKSLSDNIIYHDNLKQVDEQKDPKGIFTSTVFNGYLKKHSKLNDSFCVENIQCMKKKLENIQSIKGFIDRNHLGCQIVRKSLSSQQNQLSGSEVFDKYNSRSIILSKTNDISKIKGWKKKKFNIENTKEKSIYRSINRNPTSGNICSENKSMLDVKEKSLKEIHRRVDLLRKTCNIDKAAKGDNRNSFTNSSVICQAYQYLDKKEILYIFGKFIKNDQYAFYFFNRLFDINFSFETRILIIHFFSIISVQRQYTMQTCFSFPKHFLNEIIKCIEKIVTNKLFYLYHLSVLSNDNRWHYTKKLLLYIKLKISPYYKLVYKIKIESLPTLFYEPFSYLFHLIKNKYHAESYLSYIQNNFKGTYVNKSLNLRAIGIEEYSDMLLLIYSCGFLSYLNVYRSRKLSLHYILHQFLIACDYCYVNDFVSRGCYYLNAPKYETIPLFNDKNKTTHSFNDKNMENKPSSEGSIDVYHLECQKLRKPTSSQQNQLFGSDVFNRNNSSSIIPNNTNDISNIKGWRNKKINIESRNENNVDELCRRNLTPDNISSKKQSMLDVRGKSLNEDHHSVDQLRKNYNIDKAGKADNGNSFTNSSVTDLELYSQCIINENKKSSGKQDHKGLFTCEFQDAYLENHSKLNANFYKPESSSILQKLIINSLPCSSTDDGNTNSNICDTKIICPEAVVLGKLNGASNSQNMLIESSEVNELVIHSSDKNSCDFDTFRNLKPTDADLTEIKKLIDEMLEYVVKINSQSMIHSKKLIKRHKLSTANKIDKINKMNKIIEMAKLIKKHKIIEVTIGDITISHCNKEGSNKEKNTSFKENSTLMLPPVKQKGVHLETESTQIIKRSCEGSAAFQGINIIPETSGFEKIEECKLAEYLVLYPDDVNTSGIEKKVKSLFKYILVSLNEQYGYLFVKEFTVDKLLIQDPLKCTIFRCFKNLEAVNEWLNRIFKLHFGQTDINLKWVVVTIGYQKYRHPHHKPLNQPSKKRLHPNEENSTENSGEITENEVNTQEVASKKAKTFFSSSS